MSTDVFHVCIIREEYSLADRRAGRAYPNFEMVSQYVMGNSIDELLPVTLCSGTGHNVVIPRGQPDAATASAAIRDKLIAMG